MKSRIQFYHYYVLRILCPISLYTFLNKQISNKREKKCKLTYSIQNYFQFKLPNHGKGTCEKLTLFQCNGTKKHREPHGERGYHLEYLFFFLIFFNHIQWKSLVRDRLKGQPVLYEQELTVPNFPYPLLLLYLLSMR